MSDLEDEVLARQWFYRFELPSGRHTKSYIPPEVEDIHTTRLAMLLRAVEPVIEGGWAELTAVDLAGHQGYFAGALARQGCADVLVVDIRQEHLDDAHLMARACGLENLRCARHNIDDLDAASLGTFDITVLFGLLYHLENPVGALRLARRLTKKVCVVETQVVPNLSGVVDWGSSLYPPKPMLGTFAIIDESTEVRGGGNQETGTSGICLCPSPEAVVWLMRKLGFDRVEIIRPPEGGHEQLAHGKRIVVAGYVDS
jgi:SAM-dependent methyltransferase